MQISILLMMAFGWGRNVYNKFYKDKNEASMCKFCFEDLQLVYNNVKSLFSTQTFPELRSQGIIGFSTFTDWRHRSWSHNRPRQCDPYSNEPYGACTTYLVESTLSSISNLIIDNITLTISIMFLGKGKIVRETWIKACYKAKRRLNTQRFVWLYSFFKNS